MCTKCSQVLLFYLILVKVWDWLCTAHGTDLNADLSSYTLQLWLDNLILKTVLAPESLLMALIKKARDHRLQVGISPYDPFHHLEFLILIRKPTLCQLCSHNECSCQSLFGFFILSLFDSLGWGSWGVAQADLEFMILPATQVFVTFYRFPSK